MSRARSQIIELIVVVLTLIYSGRALAIGGGDLPAQPEPQVGASDFLVNKFKQGQEPEPEVFGTTTPGETNDEAMRRLTRECTENVSRTVYATFDAGMKGCMKAWGIAECREYSAGEKTKSGAFISLCCENFRAPGRCTDLATARLPAPPNFATASSDDDLSTSAQIDPTNNPLAGAGKGAGGVIEHVPDRAETEKVDKIVQQAEEKRKEAIAQNATVKPEANAEADAQRDLASCRNGRSRAQTCCTDPYQCGNVEVTDTGSSSKGLSACQKQKRLGQATSDLNNGLAAICSSSYQSCESTCNSLIIKYQSLVDKCQGGCESAGIYSSMVSQLSNYKSGCSSLSGRANALAAQGLNGASTAGASAACEDDTDNGEGATPNSLADLMENKKTEKDEVDKVVECMNNPGSAACQQQAQQVAAPVTSSGKESFVDGRKDPKPEDFNVDDVQPQDGYVASTERTSGEAPTVNAVPNNSGGGIPGGTPAAAGAAGGAKKAGGVAPSYTTDIFTGGFQAGGYSASAMSGLDSNTKEGLFPARRPASDKLNDVSGFRVGTDLKNFLPGGQKDPNRLRAGMYATGGANQQITSPFTDNWDKISVKFKEKCILELTGCDLRP